MTLVAAGGGGGMSGTRTGPEGLPWPQGNPGELRSAAGTASGLAHELGSRATSLLTTGRGVDSWKGPAQHAYVGDLTRNVGALRDAAGAFQDTSGALTSLASALETAQSTIRHAASRLGAAREDAGRAARHAQTARSEATSAQLAASSAAGTPAAGHLAHQAQEAERSARSVESAASQARAHATQVEQWARGQAERVIGTVRLRDTQAAAIIGHAAQRATATVAKAGHGDSNGLDALGSLVTFWGPVGLGGVGSVRALLRAKKAATWGARTLMKADGPWWKLPVAEGDILSKSFPTFDHGLVGRVTAGVLGKLPKGSSAAEFLTDAERATPIFRKLGVAGAAVSTGLDAYNVVHTYGWNPVTGFEEGGAHYVSDVTKTAFDASSMAFFVAPNPVTAGAVVVTGVAWGGAEVWEHHEAIWHGMKDAGEATWHGMQDLGSGMEHVGEGALHEGESFLSDLNPFG